MWGKNFFFFPYLGNFTGEQRFLFHAVRWHWNFTAHLGSGRSKHTPFAFKIQT